MERGFEAIAAFRVQGEAQLASGDSRRAAPAAAREHAERWAEGLRVRVLGPGDALIALAERHGERLRYLRVLIGHAASTPRLDAAESRQHVLGRAMELQKLETRLLAHLGQAIKDFFLVKAGDHIMVGISGAGKDSYTLLHLLRKMEQRSPDKFGIVAVNLDQGHPGFPAEMLESWLKGEGYAYKMVKQDTLSIVKRLVPEGKTYCSVCSKLRRGILYNTAVELGCTKIALGHHPR